MLGVAAGLTFSACAHSDGQSYATQACHYVQSSISNYDRASTAQSPAEASQLRARALAELRSAMPISSLAAADDTQWQALAATLGESSRVGEGDLVHALQAQCTSALDSSP